MNHMKNIASLIIISSSLFGIYNCSTPHYWQSNRIEEKEINITEALEPEEAMVKIIAPYKQQLDAEMRTVLTYNPYELNKGLNEKLSNLLADQLLEGGNEIFRKKYNQTIDAALLNAGGVRRTFTPGNITVGNIYELMPFENMAVVVKLSGKDFLKMIQFLKEHRVGHPIAGFSFSLDGANQNIQLKGKKFNENESYWVITNDYLQKGGDEMYFLSHPQEKINLEVKLRDIFMEQFHKNDTLKIDTTPRYLP